MPAVFRNNANAGTNGASISYTASGGADSGDDWDFIAIGPGGVSLIRTSLHVGR